MGFKDKVQASVQRASEAKATKAQERSESQATEAIARAEAIARSMAHVAGLPKWEYQVKRIGEDK